MKASLLLIILSLAGANITKAQLKNSTTPPAPDLQEKAAGFELVKATNHFYTGIILECSGTVILFAAAVSARSSGGSASSLILCGSLTIITGTIFTLESYSHIGKAGKILMQRNDLTFGPTNNGIGLSVHF